MGIRFTCPNGHKLNVKSFLAGRTGFCPYCGVKVEIPTESTRGPGRKSDGGETHPAGQGLGVPNPLASGLVSRPLPSAEVLEPLATRPVAGSAPSSVAIPTVPQIAPLQGPVASFPPVDFASHMEALATSAAAAVTPPPPQSGPSDPLSEAPDAVWYIRPPSGGQFGPAANSVMRTWLQEGRVSADTLVWREGWRDWQEASGVFPQLGAPPNLPPPAAGLSSPATQAFQARRKPSGSRALHIGALMLVVIVLAVFLVWLLQSEFSKQPEKPETAAPTISTVAAAPSAVGNLVRPA